MAEDGCMPMPAYPVRKTTLERVIEETVGANEGSRHVLITLINRHWKRAQFIGSLELGLFLGEIMGTVDARDFELVHQRIRNRDLLPIVGIDAEHC